MIPFDRRRWSNDYKACAVTRLRGAGHGIGVDALPSGSGKTGKSRVLGGVPPEKT